MKKFLLLVLALGTVAAWTPVLAETSKCLVRKECPKGTPLKDCCEKVPCEFKDQIRMKRAIQSVFRNTTLRAQMVKKAGGDQAKAAKLLHEAVVEKAKKLGSKLQCSWTEIPPPPSLETAEDCRINAPLDPASPESMMDSTSRETAHRRFNTCSEFIDAAYDHEDFHKSACEKMNSTERANLSIHDYANEEIRAYQKEIDRLRAELTKHWRACSPVEDSKTARQLASLGINTLKKSKRGGR